MKAPRPHWIAFDLDGTLVDSVPDLTDALNQVIHERYGMNVEQARVRTWVGDGVTTLLRRAYDGLGLTPDTVTQQQIRQHFNQALKATNNDKSSLYPHVHETLTQLKKNDIELALVTNKPTEFLPSLLDKFALNPYFKEIIAGDTFEKRKPDPVALNWIIEKYGIKTDALWMLGDSVIDIQAARNAGCKAISVSYGYNDLEELTPHQPDIVLHNLRELIEHISK